MDKMGGNESRALPPIGKSDTLPAGAPATKFAFDKDGRTAARWPRTTTTSSAARPAARRRRTKTPTPADAVAAALLLLPPPPLMMMMVDDGDAIAAH
jgi:hypothetical protein